MILGQAPDCPLSLLRYRVHWFDPTARPARARAAMPHKPLSQFSILSSAAGSAQIAVSSQSGDCSVGDEFQSTHLRLTRLVNSELTAACMHAAVTGGCDDLQNGRGSQYWWR